MNVREYKDAVIAFFKSGQATDLHWEEMANVVLYASEGDYEIVQNIDNAVKRPEDEFDD